MKNSLLLLGMFCAAITQACQTGLFLEKIESITQENKVYDAFRVTIVKENNDRALKIAKSEFAKLGATFVGYKNLEDHLLYDVVPRETYNYIRYSAIGGAVVVSVIGAAVFVGAQLLEDLLFKMDNHRREALGIEHLGDDVLQVNPLTFSRPLIVGTVISILTTASIYANVTYYIGYLYNLTKTKYIKDNGDAIMYVPSLEKQNMIIFVPENTHKIKECISYSVNPHDEIILNL